VSVRGGVEDTTFKAKDSGKVRGQGGDRLPRPRTERLREPDLFLSQPRMHPNF